MLFNTYVYNRGTTNYLVPGWVTIPALETERVA